MFGKGAGVLITMGSFGGAGHGENSGRYGGCGLEAHAVGSVERIRCNKKFLLSRLFATSQCNKLHSSVQRTCLAVRYRRLGHFQRAVRLNGNLLAHDCP